MRSSSTARTGSGTASPHARFAQRAAAVRRGPRRLVLVAAGLVVLLGALGWLILFSPVLAARHVQVEGVPAATAATVRHQAQVPLGRPLARVDLSAVAQRVIATGRMAQVSVSRSWPGTVIIRASRREPVLVLQNPQGQLEVVDKTGVAYATVDKAPKGVPQVSLRSVRAADRSIALRAAAETLAVLPARERARVDSVTVDGPETVGFTLGKVRVKWGDGDDGALKLKVLEALLHQKGVRANGGRIDVSAPNAPVLATPSS